MTVTIYAAKVLLTEEDHSNTRLMLDSNILNALLDTSNKFHAAVTPVIQHLYETSARLFYVQPAYLEVLDYVRRKSFTEYLAELYAAGQTMPRRFDKVYQKQVERKDEVAQSRGDPYFKDFAIKALRDSLLDVSNAEQRQAGRTLWRDLCVNAFEDRFSAIHNALGALGITYAKLNDDDVFPSEMRPYWPKWEDAVALIAKHCLASNDAAILNMAARGKDINSFMTNDYDALIAATDGALPDRIRCFTLLDW